MVRIKVRERSQVTLPKELGVPPGTEYDVQKTPDGSILFVPLITVPKSQAYFWTKRWQKGEREAEDAIQAGKMKTGKVDDLIKEIRMKRKRRVRA